MALSEHPPSCCRNFFLHEGYWWPQVGVTVAISLLIYFKIGHVTEIRPTVQRLIKTNQSFQFGTVLHWRAVGGNDIRELLITQSRDMCVPLIRQSACSKLNDSQLQMHGARRWMRVRRGRLRHPGGVLLSKHNKGPPIQNLGKFGILMLVRWLTDKKKTAELLTAEQLYDNLQKSWTSAAFN